MTKAQENMNAQNVLIIFQYMQNQLFVIQLGISVKWFTTYVETTSWLPLKFILEVDMLVGKLFCKDK
jgi:hypothetical protein